jgi:hypothetical protein
VQQLREALREAGSFARAWRDLSAIMRHRLQVRRP